MSFLFSGSHILNIVYKHKQADPPQLIRDFWNSSWLLLSIGSLIFLPPLQFAYYIIFAAIVIILGILKLHYEGIDGWKKSIKKKVNKVVSKCKEAITFVNSIPTIVKFIVGLFSSIIALLVVATYSLSFIINGILTIAYYLVPVVFLGLIGVFDGIVEMGRSILILLKSKSIKCLEDDQFNRYIKSELSNEKIKMLKDEKVANWITVLTFILLIMSVVVSSAALIISYKTKAFEIISLSILNVLFGHSLKLYLMRIAIWKLKKFPINKKKVNK